MRRCRTGLIQTPDQLRFSYLAIIEGAKRLTNPNSDQVSPNLSFSFICIFILLLGVREFLTRISREYLKCFFRLMIS